MPMFFKQDMLTIAVFLHMINYGISHTVSCTSNCNDSQNCIDSIKPMVRNLGMASKYLCFQQDTCFGGNSTSKNLVQQIPVQLLNGQDLFFSLDIASENFTIGLFNGTMDQHFLSCNFESAEEMYFEIVNSSLIYVPKLNPGIHYVIFNTTNNIYSCNFGFRIQITVFEHLCLFVNHTSCSSNGRCILAKNETKFKCKCCKGYYGHYCEDYDSCALNPCRNNGTCIGKVNGFSPGAVCNCSQHFAGLYCENCSESFEGSDCQVDVNECERNKSICNYGNCTNKYGSFECICPANFTGKYCEIDLFDNCAVNNCSSNSLCFDQFGCYKCLCHVGFTGVYCENEINKCFLNTSCSPGGTWNCTIGVSNHTCNCFPRFRDSSHLDVMISSTQLKKHQSSQGHMTHTNFITSTLFSPTSSSLFSSHSHLVDVAHSNLNSLIGSQQSVRSAKNVLGGGNGTELISPLSIQSSKEILTKTRMLIVTECLPKSTVLSIASVKLKTNSVISGASVMSPTMVSTTVSSVSTNTTPTLSVTPRKYLNITCLDSPCNGYDCFSESNNGLKFRCVCPFPTIGPTCLIGVKIQYPRFNGHTYIEYSGLKLNETSNSVIIKFHTQSLNGLLSYANHSTHKDFIMILLVNGTAEVRLSAGGGVIVINSKSYVNTGKDITIVLSLNRSSGLVTLNVNNIERISKHFSSSLNSVDITSSWFFGGIPHSLHTYPYFKGCIKAVQINEETLKLTDPLFVKNWANIGGCEVSACEKGACYNNAECEPNYAELDRFECKCENGYHGKTCKEKLPYCRGDPCNGGICIQSSSGKQCLCQYGRFEAGCLVDRVISLPHYTVNNNYSSYIAYPWQQTGQTATDRFEVRLQFKFTDLSEKNGLLVYMGESKISTPSDDFLAISIHERFIYLVFNLGSGLGVIKSEKEIEFNRKWHFLVGGRTNQLGYLYVDSQSKVMGSSAGIFTGLDIFTPLFIGGVPDFNRLPAPLKPYVANGFTGIIHDVAVRTNTQSFVPLLTLKEDQVLDDMIGIPVESGLNIEDKNKKTCNGSFCSNNGTCVMNGDILSCICKAPFKGPNCQYRNDLCTNINPCSKRSSCRIDGFDFKCDCPFGLTGVLCSQELDIGIPYFEENSYLLLTRVNIRVSFTIVIRFKPAVHNGLLFYTARSIQSTDGDFLAISLWRSYVYVRFNLGARVSSMRSHKKVQLHSWHSLFVRRKYREAIMQLDSDVMIGIVSSGSMSMLDVGSDFYLGGVPYSNSINEQAVKEKISLLSFKGAISDFRVNLLTYLLNSSNPTLVGRNINDDTLRSCNGIYHCQNDGVCKSNKGKCQCLLGFIGKYCEKKTMVLMTAHFNSSSYWYTRLKFRLLETTHYEFSFKMEPEASNGILLWHGYLQSFKDFLAIGIQHGRLNVTFSLDGVESTVVTPRRYDDSAFHSVVMDRIGNKILFFVNGDRPQILWIKSSKRELNSYGYIYIGGLPDSVYEMSGHRYADGFHGCISNVTFTQGRKSYINFASIDQSSGLNLQECL